jgi:hypothetical protein
MLSKIISGAVLMGLLLGVSAPASFAKDAPMTKKEECARHKNWHWDDTSSKCVKN